MRKIFQGFLVILFSIGSLACNQPVNKNDNGDDASLNEKNEKKKGKKKDKETDLPMAAIEILQKWDLPTVLTEISDIDNIDDRSFLAVQDESGILFVYDLAKNNIVKEIPFAGKGDYEGIALAGKTAYVVNSGGEIFEVVNIDAAKPAVNLYKTFLTSKDDVEALCYDKPGNRLLVAYKAEESGGSTKGIYAFDLKTKTLEKQPVYSIDFDKNFPQKANGKKKTSFKPSAIAVQPGTGDIYLLEGTEPRIMSINREGDVKLMASLDNKIFQQPEGITFNSTGEMFISNEGGKDGKGNILKVKL